MSFFTTSVNGHLDPCSGLVRLATAMKQGGDARGLIDAGGLDQQAAKGEQGGIEIDGVTCGFYTPLGVGQPTLPEVPYHFNTWGMVRLKNFQCSTNTAATNFLRFWNSTGRLTMEDFHIAITQGEIDRDHVPMKQLYGKEFRKLSNPNLFCLPTHAKCNRGYQFDEDYFVYSLAPVAIFKKEKAAIAGRDRISVFSGK